MTDAPERILAVTEPDDISADILGDVYAQQVPDGMVGTPTQYIRADLLAAHIGAALEEAAYHRTGVFDRDGREICVGDRIRIDLTSPNTKREYWCPEYQVAFKPPHFTLEHVGGDKDSDTARFYFSVPQKISTEKITTLSIRPRPDAMQALDRARREARVVVLAALQELLDVSKRAVWLSQKHDEFKLYGMEPMWRAIAAADALIAAEERGEGE